MRDTKLDFEKYVHSACQYAYIEYDLGVKSAYALISLDEHTVEMLGLCWVSRVSVPDAANLIAYRVKS